ncbi:MAG: hypothetical protein WC565_05925 [Parcubacteria group bacterium]
MSFSELTPEQQNVLGEYVRLLRAWSGEQARTNNHGQALNSDYAQVQAVLAELQDSDVIADGSGLAGAGQLTKAEVVSLTAQSQGLLASYDQAGQRQAYAKAAGPGNLIG